MKQAISPEKALIIDRIVTRTVAILDRYSDVTVDAALHLATFEESFFSGEDGHPLDAPKPKPRGLRYWLKGS